MQNTGIHSIQSEIFIHVISGDKEETIALSKFDTIADLKYNIFNYFQVHPTKQILQGWRKEPECDANVLEFCDVDTDDLNYLILCESESPNQTEEMEISPQENTVQADCNNYEEMSVTDDFTNNSCAHTSEGNVDCTNNNNHTEMTKEEERKYRLSLFESSYSFIDKFANNFGDVHVTLHTSSLEDAMKTVILAPLAKKKILLLYLHVDGSDFSKMFCRNINQKQVAEVLEDSFYIIGYDLQDEYESALLRALKEFYKLCDATNLVTKRISAALLIVPINDTFALYSCLRGNVSDGNFLTALKNCQSYLKEEFRQEQELSDLAESSGSANDIGSTEYQQLMYDLLGDRDFDCYLKTEHDLLKQKIGFSLFGPPTSEEGYNKKQKKKVDLLYNAILKENYEEDDGFVVMKIIYNCTEPLPSEKCKRAKKYPDYNPKTDICPIPIFVIRKCRPNPEGCRSFIDDSCRVYNCWIDYIRKNKLDKCEMVLPKNGTYGCDDKGQVLLEIYLSPACDIDSKLLEIADVSSTVAGLTSTGVLAASLIPTLTIAPVALVAAGTVGITVGLYSVGRSAYTLYDKKKHKESMSFANSEARGAYINILAGSLGFVGAGANVVVSELIARGFNIGRGAGIALNTLGMVNIGTSGVAIANSGYDVVDQWINENRHPTPLTILQLGSSILFFGHAVYNFKAVGTMVEETQTNIIEDYQASLRSNRHRRTFNKLLKETIKNNNGDISKGHAQVIKAIRNIQNKDEVFAVLTRNNKLMNEKGIKYSVENGEIKFNGYTIDVNIFASMNKGEANNLLSNLPSAPPPSSSEISTINANITSTFNSFKISNISPLDALAMIQNLVHFCCTATKEKLIVVSATLIDGLLKQHFDIFEKISTLFPGCGSPFYRILQLVTNFFEKKAVELEEQYERWQKTKDANLDCYLFHVNIDMSTAPSRFVKFFTYCIDIAFTGPGVTRKILEELISYFYNWVAEKIVLREQCISQGNEDVTPEQNKDKIQNKCDACQGYYYCNNK